MLPCHEALFVQANFKRIYWKRSNLNLVQFNLTLKENSVSWAGHLTKKFAIEKIDCSPYYLSRTTNLLEIAFVPHPVMTNKMRFDQNGILFRDTTYYTVQPCTFGINSKPVRLRSVGGRIWGAYFHLKSAKEKSNPSAKFTLGTWSITLICLNNEIFMWAQDRRSPSSPSSTQIKDEIWFDTLIEREKMR